MARYGAVARQVRAHMLELTPLVEPLSIDEAFLDLSGTALLHRASPALALARFARRVESEIGISVSIGLSYCKFLAKIASDLDKPRGFKAIGRAEARDFLAQRPVGLIWGVGAVAQERLAREGFRLIGDIQAASQAEFARRMAAGGLGGEGLRLWRLANGLDDRPVSPDRETKSVSAETTFEEDVRDLDHLARTLLALSEKVSARLKAQDIGGATVTLKLKTADFRLRTRARTLPEPTRLAGRIFEAARGLLEKEAQGAAFRLIGVGVSALADARDCDLGDLADTTIGREKAAEGAIDALRARFGGGAIVRGLLFDPAGRRNPR
jgi:DNA polymerase-4